MVQQLVGASGPHKIRNKGNQRGSKPDTSILGPIKQKRAEDQYLLVVAEDPTLGGCTCECEMCADKTSLTCTWAQRMQFADCVAEHKPTRMRRAWGPSWQKRMGRHYVAIGKDRGMAQGSGVRLKVGAGLNAGQECLHVLEQSYEAWKERESNGAPAFLEGRTGGICKRSTAGAHAERTAQRTAQSSIHDVPVDDVFFVP